MKKNKKIKLKLDKEIISSLSSNEMNSIQGGVIFSNQKDCTKPTGYSVCNTCVCDTNVACTFATCPSENCTTDPWKCYNETNQTSKGEGMCYETCAGEPTLHEPTLYENECDSNPCMAITDDC